MSRRTAGAHYEDHFKRIWNRVEGGWQCSSCGHVIKDAELADWRTGPRTSELDLHNCDEARVEEVMDS